MRYIISIALAAILSSCHVTFDQPAPSIHTHEHPLQDRPYLLDSNGYDLGPGVAHDFNY